MLASCAGNKKVAYFRDLQNMEIDSMPVLTKSLIQKNDILSISVSSLNPEASVIFNTPNLPASGVSVAANSTLSQSVGYLVDENGYIKFPVLGPIKAEGLTKNELTTNITHRLNDQKLLKDPIVTVRQLNFHVTVLGEVARPTVVPVPNEKINILEAIGLAGDLTIFAKRDNVLLIREENGIKNIQRINLNNSDLLTSPYYYLKSSDIVYVEPNKARVRSGSTSMQVMPLILSGLSFIAILATRLIK